jgi:hypothetical protein
MADYRRQHAWTARRRDLLVDIRQGEAMLCRRAEEAAERISGVSDVPNQVRFTRIGNGHNWAADSSRASGPGITSSRHVNEASSKGTSSTSTSGTSA